MVLPWSHRLPDYAKLEPEYGQNLPRLAAALARLDGQPVSVLDIGANVGDTALQILDATDGKVLCVEADGGFLPFLHRNADTDTRIVIEPSLLLPEDADGDASGESGATWAPVRVGGTTRFEPGSSKDTASTVSVAELRRRHPEFDGLRLAKSDTDGYDVVLIPSVAKTYADSHPVLFFEYDHELSRRAGNDAHAVWAELADLGYARVVPEPGGKKIYEITDEGRAHLAEHSGTVNDIFDRIAKFVEGFTDQPMMELNGAFQRLARATFKTATSQIHDKERIDKIRQIIKTAADEIEALTK